MRAARLPYRGRFGAARPAWLRTVPLPPAAMPSHWGARPLKAWRYVGVYGPELMVCAAVVRIGRVHQSFWAVWDRTELTLCERTILGHGPVRLSPGQLTVRDASVLIDLRLREEAGVETVCPSGPHGYAWTRKQGGVPAVGEVALRGRRRPVEALAVIDDTAAYYARHTRWRWSAGVGTAADGRTLAWSLVSGVNDPPAASERTVWVDGIAREVGPCRFADDLSGVEDLRFTAEATRERSDSLLLVRSRYRQPFGTFQGELPGGIALAAGYGVMEEHEAWW